jgi:hypothetical protein
MQTIEKTLKLLYFQRKMIQLQDDRDKNYRSGMSLDSFPLIYFELGP